MAIIKTFQGKSPQWGERCYLADNATLIGDCTLGNDCSIWFGAVIRADINSITLGDRTNLQDCACIHVAHGEGRCTIGNDVSIGHNATVHACTVGNGALIGMGGDSARRRGRRQRSHRSRWSRGAARHSNPTL